MSAVYLQKRRWRIVGLISQRTLIDHGILARPLKAAHQATAAALVSSALLLVVATSHISLVVAGVRLGVAIASHLAFESLLAFAEEAVHVEGWGGLSNGR
jgi:hypothetical protein